MARIDVSELMNDPDFISEITIVRRVPTVNQYGTQTFVETLIVTHASVQGIGRNALLRLPEGVQAKNMKTIYCMTPIYSDVAGGYADQIIFESLRYNVMNVIPWNNFGQGWYEADIVLEKASL